MYLNIITLPKHNYVSIDKQIDGYEWMDRETDNR